MKNNITRARWTILHDTELRMWWAIGLFSYKIAERLGRTEKSIQWRAKRINLPPRRKSPAPPLIQFHGNVFND